jgi:hypothetical protein
MSENVNETPEATKPVKTRNRYNVSSEKFVEVWQASASAAEVSEKLGMPKNIVLARSATYRKAGVVIKKMPRQNPRRLDVAGLNVLVGAPKA